MEKHAREYCLLGMAQPLHPQHVAAVVPYTRSEQDQARQHSTMDGGRTHNSPHIATTTLNT